jgi:hypothetical protein
VQGENTMSQSKLISEELQKFIDEEFAKLKCEVAEAFAKQHQIQQQQQQAAEAAARKH